jgi:hypothetical protein
MSRMRLIVVVAFSPEVDSISERDLNELQKRALIEGLPYQTYVSSIIHKFINGKLIEASK